MKKIISKEFDKEFDKGKDMGDFLDIKKAKTNKKKKGDKKMNKYTGYCVKCRAKKDILEVRITLSKNGRRIAKGVCPVCKTKMCRFLKKEK